jgi:hypothetical protein
MPDLATPRAPHGMQADPSKPLSAFGFLTAIESPQHGLFGGYLVLSPLGRPLEFRCSTPIVPSRAQVILYGPTLRPYLLAEVIGQALVSQAEISVGAILTDLPDMLALATLRSEPVLCLADANGDSSPPTAHSCVIADRRVTAPPTWTGPAAAIQQLLAPLAAHIDLIEPFGRIRAALDEAQISFHEATDYADERSAA